MSGLFLGIGIVALWFLNFGISWFNAWACGKGKVDAEAAGGWPVFANWCGLIMSASGFTWCYLMVAAVLFGGIPVGEGPDAAPLLTPEQVSGMMSLGYVVIILPILGSGIALTVDSYGHFFRRRTLGSGGVAAWNTYAQISNTVSAMRHLPGALREAGGLFKGGDKKGGALVVLLVVFALLGGCLTTYAIYSASAASSARRMKERVRARREHARASR